MYLNLPAASKTKWRFSGLGMNPVRLPNLGMGAGADGVISSRQSWRMRGLRGLGVDLHPGQTLPGQTIDPGYCTYFQADGVTPESFDFNTSPSECASNGGAFTPALNTPGSSGAQNPSPVSGGASNGGITTVPATTPSKSPLDYVSPQAAIAAGLDPQTVYNAWSQALARFPSPQAAIAAGVPAGVVNQLWQQANVDAANKKAASASSIPSWLLPAGIGIGLLAILRGGRR